VVVLSDTHIPDFAKRVPAALFPELRRADLILHAGDITVRSVLEELEGYAPVRAALGNGDRRDVTEWGARDEVRFEIDGLPAAMVHNAGPSKGRERRLRRRFPGTRLIVFGHSHIPVDAEVEGVRLLNPGSPTWKRRQPAPTFARIDTGDGRLSTRIVEVGAPPA
jgi:putative phosphoesterase